MIVVFDTGWIIIGWKKWIHKDMNLIIKSLFSMFLINYLVLHLYILPRGNNLTSVAKVLVANNLTSSFWTEVFIIVTEKSWPRHFTCKNKIKRFTTIGSNEYMEWYLLLQWNIVKYNWHGLVFLKDHPSFFFCWDIWTLSSITDLFSHLFRHAPSAWTSIHMHYAYLDNI